MTTTPYRLAFENDPWEMLVIRNGEVIFHLKTGYALTGSESGSQSKQFHFQDCSLSIREGEGRLVLEWAGKGIVNRIPLTGLWYGGGELIHQPLVLNQVMFPMTEFITDDNGSTGLANLLSPTWLNSQGIVLDVRSDFSIGINQPPEKYLERQRGLSEELIPFNQRPFIDHKDEGDRQITLAGDDLAYDVLIQKDVLGGFQALSDSLGRPEKTPPLELLGAPIWTTWARYKDRIDQQKVLDFAREIVENDYPFHVLEIDDRWQIRYGDLEFDPTRFPDPRGMIEQLHAKGFMVTAWVIPFFHPHSRTGAEAAEKGYVATTAGGEPYLVKWWQGRGYLLDVTQPRALAWFKNQLDEFLKEFGLDGYKFDAGEGRYAPRDAVFHSPLPSPNHYSHLYVKWISENYSFCEVRSGWRSQASPIFFRLWDLWSVWGYDNGLRSIIPATLALGLAGYPFVFPDMIGGNAYFTFPRNKILNWILQRIVVPILDRKVKKNSEYPEDETLGLADVPGWLEKSTSFGYPTPELMVRWAQANVFLGVMQFSLAPWDFGEECNRLCREAAELHLAYVPTLEKYTRRAVETGEPVIRPVFWLAPEDENALLCGDQFLVGDEILVAPVLYRGQTSREIYFPPGSWRDPETGEVFQGPMIIDDYPAPLSKLPYFLREGHL